LGQSYTELVVWQRARQLVKLVYEFSREFPRDEIYGLTSQLRRAAVSVPSNIAEGQARQSQKDFLRFLSVARGSLAEVQTQAMIAFDLGYVLNDKMLALLEETKHVYRLLNALYGAIERRVNNGSAKN